MKNFFTVLFFTSALSGLNAQIHKGDVFLGGTFGFTTLIVDGNSATTINLTPNVGYLASDQFAIGGKIGLSLVTAEGSSISTVALNPFLRYYFNKAGIARVFGDAGVGFQSDHNGDITLNSLKLTLGLGVDIFLNDNVAIEGYLGYERANYLQNDYPFDTDGYNIVGLNFGVITFLHGKKDKG